MEAMFFVGGANLCYAVGFRAAPEMEVSCVGRGRKVQARDDFYCVGSSTKCTGIIKFLLGGNS